jgi:hypothetical protein
MSIGEHHRNGIHAREEVPPMSVQPRGQGRPRVRLLLFVIAVVLALCAGYARAACTSNTWTYGDETGYSTTGDFGDTACESFSAWFLAFGGPRVVHSCTVDGMSFSASVTGGDGNLHTWTGTRAGTCDPEEPPPSQTIVATIVLPDWMNLSAEDGLALSVAILTVWGSAFAFRAAVRALGTSDGDQT